MQVLASQLPFLANRNAEQAVPPLFWPVNCIKIGRHVALLSGPSVYVYSVVRAFEEPEQDYLVVADTLSVNRSTARGIVARFIRENRVDERPRGGRNNVKVNAEMRLCLEAILEENPMLTLEAINRKLREELPDVRMCTFAQLQNI